MPSETIQVACPACLTANRVPAERVSEDPKCGRCGAPLLPGAPIELAEAAFDDFVRRASRDRGLLGAVVRSLPRDGAAVRKSCTRAQGRARLVKVNTEQAPGLAARMNIRAIPTIALFRNGAEVKRVSGALDAGSLVRWAQS